MATSLVKGLRRLLLFTKPGACAAQDFYSSSPSVLPGLLAAPAGSSRAMQAARGRIYGRKQLTCCHADAIWRLIAFPVKNDDNDFSVFRETILRELAN
ncbi:hypothetical protein TNCT_96761 [Trichonephila clavata]|uniref:Uncharacterized protein n=1 Tax=Trichonephila clavata TaxID=2740835 RepID=A0A8X6FNQ2_TRICU|nr:hypothetical protein TNCT_96761 [Trichonephila clavata]